MPPSLRLRRPSSYPLSLIERISRGSYAELFSLWIGANISFGALYFLLATYAPAHAPRGLPEIPEPAGRFLNSLYFSIITATSTGYGDIVPLGFSKVLASIQCILALVVFAVFVTKLVSRQQDVAMQDVHRMAYVGIFYSIRQGLFIVRKDCDRIMRQAEQERKLDLREWENLTSAYLQAQSLLEEIPDFYRTESNLYTIDKKREELLIDAFQRTLGRIVHLLETLTLADIDWPEHQESIKQLASLVTVIDSAIATWERYSPYHTIEHFDHILRLRDRLHATLEQHRIEPAPAEG